MKVIPNWLKQYVGFDWSLEELTGRILIVRQVLIVAFLLVSINVNAADKMTVIINRQTISAYRTIDLESAKKEAKAAHKPIAWIATSPKMLDGQGTIALANSRGATLHAFYALRDKAVIVYEDAYEENHKVLPLVDAALHTPDPHYTPPTVIFLDPDATNVLAKVIYEPNFQKRAMALANALEEIKGKY
jgi:hypothetical protein